MAGSLFGGPLSTRADCEDRSVRTKLLEAERAQQAKQGQPAARKHGSAHAPHGGKAKQGGGAQAKPQPKPQPPADPKAAKRKALKNDLDAFDDLDGEGPSTSAAGRPKSAKPPAPSKGGRMDEHTHSAGGGEGRNGGQQVRPGSARSGGDGGSRDAGKSQRPQQPGSGGASVKGGYSPPGGGLFAGKGQAQRPRPAAVGGGLKAGRSVGADSKPRSVGADSKPRPRPPPAAPTPAWLDEKRAAARQVCVP
jgi:hypothetical protein